MLLLLALWSALVMAAPLTPGERARYEKVVTRAQSRLAAHPDDLKAKWVLAHALADLRRFDESKGAFREVLDAATKRRDPRLQVLGYDGLARVARQTGDPETALSLLQHALEIAVATGDSELQMKIRGNIAYAEIRAGRPEKARPVLEEILRTVRSAGKHDEAAIAATQLGEIELRAGNLSGAERFFRAALAEAELTTSERTLEMTRTNLETVLKAKRAAR